MKKAIGSSGKIRTETLFRQSLVVVGVAMVILVAGILFTLILESIPSIKHLGLKYLWGTTWDPLNNVYGAAPFFLAPLLPSFLALFFSIRFLLQLLFTSENTTLKAGFLIY